MKKRWKIIALALALVLACPLALFSLTGCGDRTELLKVYNWGEYMADGSDDSMDVIAEFTNWYEEHTGKKIKVEYTLFDNNETMYTQISNKHADYDVICPSDYTVQKMLTNDLLLPLNDGNFDRIWGEVFEDEDPETYGLSAGEKITLTNIVREDLAELITVYDEGWGKENGDIYSVPYMWGTFGLLYDKSKIEKLGGTAEDMQSWNALFGDTAKDKFSGHIYMKNSVRDAFAAANIYNNKENLGVASAGYTDYSAAAYREILNNCMNYPNDLSIAAAEVTLKEQKKHLFAYESDEGKEDLMMGKSAAALGFVWSCDAGYVIGQENNTELWYSVPKEGTNVWVDSWCIPRYAGNKTAAQYFIAFMNRYDAAYENMYWVGAATPVAQAAEDIAEEINNPKSLFVSEYDDEDEAAAEWDRLVSIAKDRTSPENKEAYGKLSEYVYFLDVYLDSHDSCTDGDDCTCDWHKYAQMYSECLMPTDEHVERAAIMTDFAEYNVDIVRMFTRVKAS